MNKRYLYLFLFVLVLVFNIQTSDALKATVIGFYKGPDTYADNLNKCGARDIWIQLTELSGTISNIVTDSPAVTLSLLPALYENSTMVTYKGSIEFTATPNIITVNLQVSTTDVTTGVVLLTEDNQQFQFQCLARPQSPTQATFIRPLQMDVSTYGYTSKFIGYFSLDPVFTKGIPDYQCQATDYSTCTVDYIGNGIYLAQFDLVSTYTGDLTLNSGRFVFQIGGFQMQFDNPTSTTLYKNLLISQPTIENVVSGQMSGGVFPFVSNQDIMPLITGPFRALKGNFKNLSLFFRYSGSQVRYMSNSLFSSTSSLPTPTPLQLTNTWSQSQTGVNLQIDTMYYAICGFSTNKKYYFSSDSNQKVDTSFPFGLKSVTNNIPDYKISTLFSPYQFQYRFMYGVNNAGFSRGYLISGYNNSDTTASKLKSLNVFPLNNTHSVFSVELSDDISGVGDIFVLLSNIGESIHLNQHALVRGTLLDGTFEKILPIQKYTNFQLTVSDRSGNAFNYGEDSLYLLNRVGKMLYKFYEFDITHLQFQKSSVDVSVSSVTNTLYLNFTLPAGVDRKFTSVQFKPILTPNKNVPTVYSGIYDQQTKLYVINFLIPAKTFTSELLYLIYINGIVVPSTSYLSKFESQSRLYITSSEFDQMFPIITSVSVSHSQEVDYSVSQVSISWTIKVSDENFVKKFIVQIASSYDLEGFTSTWDGSPSPSVEYVVTKQLDSTVLCKDQEYYIKYIYTEDSLGNFGETFRDVNLDIHPFYKIEPAYPDSIKVKCTPSISRAPPVLTTATVNQKLNVTTKVPTAIVNFSVSGNRGPSLPSCYFHSYPMDFLSTKAVLMSEDTLNNIIKYSCTIDLPYRYGPLVAVSIYGIVDSLGQVIGYPTSDMPATGKEFTSIASTYQGPVIDYVWRDGDKIGVTGTQLYQGEIFVYVDDVASTKPLTIETATGIAIIAGGFTYLANSTVYVSVFNPDLSEESNRLLLIKGTPSVTPSPSPSPFCNSDCGEPLGYGKCENGVCVCNPPHIGLDCKSIDDNTTPNPSSSPSPTPTPSPTPIACKSDCGEPQDYGKCVNGACVCNPLHSGIDCKAKTDNTTVITPNPVKPSVNVTIPGTSSGQTPEFISFIYVVALRELDNTDTLINNYVFNSDKWILVKEGSSSNDQVTTVQYKYLIDSYNTTIVSTVQVFTQATNITFGNQQLFMNPSTIKFTFNITSYPFSKSTNSLQLVMTAALESTEKVACSYKEFVDDQSSSQYLKIQIEDRSLFGRFIKFGMIDGREQVVSNSILDSSYGGKELSKSTSDQSYIGLNIPYYTKYALIDPDFSVLVEQNTARDQADSICTRESKKLTNAQIAGIVVGGVVFLFIIGAVAIYFYTRKSTSPIALKLRKIGTR